MVSIAAQHSVGAGVSARWIIAASALIALLAGKTALADPELVEEGQLNIGSDLTYPPFVYMDGGEPAGFDVEIMQALADRLSLEPNFVDTRFAALIPGIRAQQFDVIASALYVTEERQRVLSFLPYTKAGSSILVLAAAEDKPATEDDLCGKSVSSIRGASWTPKLQAFAAAECGGQSIDVREFDTDAQATQAMRAGAVAAQIIDNVVAEELLRRLGDEFEVSSTEVLYPVTVALGVLPEKPALFEALTEAMREIRADGTYDALVEEYGMVPVSDEEIAEITGLGD